MAEKYTVRGQEIISWRGRVMFKHDDAKVVAEVCALLNSVYGAAYQNGRGDVVEHGGGITWA